MDALHILTDDHQRMRQLVENTRLQDLTHEKRAGFDQLVRILKDHFNAAESLLYPEAARLRELRPALTAELEIHDRMKRFVKRIAKNRDDREFSNQLEKLLHRVEALCDREENNLFPQIWHQLPHLQLLQIGMLIQRHRNVVDQHASARGAAGD